MKVWPGGVQVVTHGSEPKAQGSAGQHGIDESRGELLSCCAVPSVGAGGLG